MTKFEKCFARIEREFDTADSFDPGTLVEIRDSPEHVGLVCFNGIVIALDDPGETWTGSKMVRPLPAGYSIRLTQEGFELK